MWTCADETRAVNNIGSTLLDRLEERRVFIGVVFEVGVLDNDRVACDMCYAGTDGRAFAEVCLVYGQMIDFPCEIGAVGTTGERLLLDPMTGTAILGGE